MQDLRREKLQGLLRVRKAEEVKKERGTKGGDEMSTSKREKREDERESLNYSAEQLGEGSTEQGSQCSAGDAESGKGIEMTLLTSSPR